MSEKEKYLISFYNSTNNKIGYNISTGGKGGDTYSKNPNLEDIRNKFKGNKNPMFGKSVYSVWLEKYGKDNADKRMNDRGNKQKKYVPWSKGKTNVFSEDTINRMKDSATRKDVDSNSIKKLIDDGKNVRETCKILNISYSLYYKIMNTNERKSFMKTIDYNLIDSLLKDGKSIKEICNIVNVTRQTCYKHFKKTNQKYPKQNKPKI